MTDAERLVRQYLDGHTNSAEAHFLLGFILFREIQEEAKRRAQVGSGKYSELTASGLPSKEEEAKASLAEFTAGAQYREPSAFDLKIVGLDYVLLADYTDADKWLFRSLERNPQDSEGWYYLGRTRYNENRFTEAIGAFEHCLKLDPRNVKAEDNLGLSYAGLGQSDEAIAAYQQAIAWQADLPSKSPEPYIDYGALLIEKNHPQEAVPLLLQAIQIDPGESRAHEKLGKGYLALNLLSQAQAEFEAAIALAPGNASLHYLLGQVYRKEGFSDKAKFELERFSALNGTAVSGSASKP
ncbi:MAG: tetratricopeptide repeat protein [Candidatus Acidiferrum sp.]